jgi:hypothetical protein
MDAMLMDGRTTTTTLPTLLTDDNNDDEIASEAGALETEKVRER